MVRCPLMDILACLTCGAPVAYAAVIAVTRDRLRDCEVNRIGLCRVCVAGIEVGRLVVSCAGYRPESAAPLDGAAGIVAAQAADVKLCRLDGLAPALPFVFVVRAGVDEHEIGRLALCPTCYHHLARVRDYHLVLWELRPGGTRLELFRPTHLPDAASRLAGL